MPTKIPVAPYRILTEREDGGDGIEIFGVQGKKIGRKLVAQEETPNSSALVEISLDREASQVAQKIMQQQRGPFFLQPRDIVILWLNRTIREQHLREMQDVRDAIVLSNVLIGDKTVQVIIAKPK